MNDPAKRLAIVARSPDAVSQTFVRRHIEHLNGGNTVVICDRRYEDGTFGRPLYFYDRSRTVAFVGAFTGMRQAFSNLLTPRNNGQLRDFLREKDVTHVLMEFGYIATDLGDELLASGLPVYCMFRGNDASGHLTKFSYRRRLKKVFNRLSGVIAVSSHLLDNLAAHGMRHENSLIAPSGADTRLFVPGTPLDGLCICVGRMVEKKSPLPLIRAFAKSANEHSLTLEFIGDGPLEGRAKGLAQELGIADRITFHGRMPHEKVIERMRNAMMYVQHFQTSENGETEGMPGVISEAMACGLPVITTRHGGIPDHLSNGVNSILLEPGDEDGFANALLEMSKSLQIRQKLGAEAREYAITHLDYRISHRKIEEFMGIAAP